MIANIESYGHSINKKLKLTKRFYNKLFHSELPTIIKLGIKIPGVIKLLSWLR